MNQNYEMPESGTEKRVRVAIYVRVSTVYQIDKDSLPMMKQDLTSYCKYILNTDDYVIFEDAGYSGKNTARPAYQKMMSQIREGLFTHLLVWKIDRISRNLLDFANMYQELKDLGVTFVSKNEQFDTSTAIGEAMLKIILIFAELERNMTSERVTATMINRASNGVWNGGRVPYGYDYDKENQIFSINPEENVIYNFLLDTYEKTGSMVITARTLNDSGYRTRNNNLWSPVGVCIILHNPWYKGVYRYNYYKIPGRKAVKDQDEWVVVENHHPASIDPERFEHIQKLIASNARNRNAPGRKTTRKNTHVFSNLLWCAECGAAFVASPGKIRASGYRPSKYGCPNVRKTEKCHAKYVSDGTLGEFLLNYILNILNVQKNFASIQSIEDLQKQLLHGSTFENVDHINEDGLLSLYTMLEKFPGKESVLTRPVTVKPKVDPEIKRLVADQKKQQRALERLDHLYLYSDNPISEREYVIRKQQILDCLQEINETLGMTSQEHWTRIVSDNEFIRQASSFILTQKLSDRQYIYYDTLAESIQPEILKNFFLSLLDSVILKDGLPQTIVFRNGLCHTFTYKNNS